MRRRFTQFLTVTATTVIFAGSGLFAADPVRPSTECLPDNTVGFIRMPDGQKALDALRANTKLGQVMFSKERIDNAFTKVKAKKPKEYAQFEEKLGTYGLKPEDLREIFTGDFGVAVSMTPQPAGDPKTHLFVWMEPKGATGSKLYAAAQKAIEQSPTKPVRTDLSIEGVKAMKVVSPRFQVEFTPPEIPENFDKMTAEERAKWFEEQSKKNQEPKKTKIGEDITFMALLGNRIILVSAGPDKGNPRGPGQPKTIKPADAAEADATEALFAQFLKAHLASGKPTTFIEKMTKTPGVQQALPAGVIFAEGFLDVGQIVSAGVNQGAQNSGKDPKKVAEALGISNLGPMAFRATLNGNLNNMTVFLSSPAPRKGLLSLLDQPELKPEPADWAPSSLASYAHWSFDLAKAYKVAKEVAVAMEGPEAEKGFQDMETQSQGMLQVDVATLLGSLGVQHSLGLYPIEPKAKPAKPEGAEAEEMPEMPEVTPRTLVWRLTDQNIWVKIMNQLKPLVGMAGGQVVPADEQGFTGYRTAPGTPMDGAIMTGKNYLMFALGPKVAEQTLSALNTPPAGEAGLKTSKLYAQAKTVMKLKPGVGFTITNNDKTGEHAIEGMLKGIEQMVANSESMSPEEAEALAGLIREILPKPEEMKGVYGVGVGQAFNSPTGLTLEGITELPK
jgi:hypothetical protein